MNPTAGFLRLTITMEEKLMFTVQNFKLTLTVGIYEPMETVNLDVASAVTMS